MRAAYVHSFDTHDPLSGLKVGHLPAPDVPADWVPITVRASTVNHHDLWSLRGVGLRAEQLPMVLGCDAAGVDPDGREVIVHAVIGEGVDETLDPQRSLLSELHPGTLADTVWVPSRNLIPKPPELSWAQAACVPTAWLTAYRMLISRGAFHGGMGPASVVLVQGAGGGVSTAAALLAKAFGARVYVTSRDAEKRERIAQMGLIACEPGARLPERVDIVIETVGQATIDHSLKCAKPGARIVVAGATSGFAPTVDLRRVFFQQLSIVGSTMGTRTELCELVNMLVRTGVRPLIDSIYAFEDVSEALTRLESGKSFGKVVLEH
ncbi:MAG: zinc-binding dehydrogenase [Corynebacteriales bacterium]|nr:zinc-binding dehydrogenase [Mycobacteriales bacterium]